MLSEFERRAWESRVSSEQHKPDMALKATLDQIERGEIANVKHIVVVVIEDMRGGDFIQVVQAGVMSELAVEGALARAIRVQRGD